MKIFCHSLFLGFTLFFSPFLLLAQEDEEEKPQPSVVETVPSSDTRFEEGTVLYKKEVSGGILIHSGGGGGINYRQAQHKTAFKKQLWQAEFVTMKHPKEHKSSNTTDDDAKQFAFGKKNDFTILRPSFGRQNILYSKETRRGVQVSCIYLTGISIGFLKPVYLEIARPSVSSDKKTFTTEKYDEEKHTIEVIYGRASYLKGIEETKIHPGIHGKFALNFEYAPYFDRIRALETGITFDAFYKEVPIMAFAKNQQFFLTFYVNLQFGKKSYN